MKTQATITPDFIQIPAPVLLADIPPSHKILYGYIYWYTKLALQTCTASNESLGRLTGLTRRSVTNAITELKNKGFISVEFDGKPGHPKTKRTINVMVSYAMTLPRKSDRAGILFHVDVDAAGDRYALGVRTVGRLLASNSGSLVLGSKA